MKKGLAPGSLVYVGKQKVDKPTYQFTQYSQSSYDCKSFKKIAQISERQKDDTSFWLHITGLHNVDDIRTIGELFSVNTLLLENIMDTKSRPMFSEDKNTLFFIAKSVVKVRGMGIGLDHFCILKVPGGVISFSEDKCPFLDALHERFKLQTSRLRRFGSDYLCYALFDILIDEYTDIINDLGERIENMETSVIQDQNSERLIKFIAKKKRDLAKLRKVLGPYQENMLKSVKSEFGHITPDVAPYMRDLSDHITHARENVDAHREMLSDFLSIHQTNVSNRMNEVMKFLTVFSAIFIPLGFLAGVYGTNFAVFPELGWKYMYPTFWAIVVCVAGFMIYVFKRRGWL